MTDCTLGNLSLPRFEAEGKVCPCHGLPCQIWLRMDPLTGECTPVEMKEQEFEEE